MRINEKKNKNTELIDEKDQVFSFSLNQNLRKIKDLRERSTKARINTAGNLHNYKDKTRLDLKK